MNIIITGVKQRGKTTAMRKILESLDGSISGFITEFSDRTSAGRKLILKSIDGANSCCAAQWSEGQPSIFMSAFDDFAPTLIKSSSDYIIIDELGKFEIDSKNLERAVTEAFDSEADVIAVMRYDAEGWIQKLKFREDVSVLTLDALNRNYIPEKVLSLLAAKN